MVRLAQRSCSPHCNFLTHREFCEFTRFNEWLELRIKKAIALQLRLSTIADRLANMGDAGWNFGNEEDVIGELGNRLSRCSSWGDEYGAWRIRIGFLGKGIDGSVRIIRAHSELLKMHGCNCRFSKYEIEGFVTVRSSSEKSAEFFSSCRLCESQNLTGTRKSRNFLVPVTMMVLVCTYTERNFIDAIPWPASRKWGFSPYSLARGFSGAFKLSPPLAFRSSPFGTRRSPGGILGWYELDDYLSYPSITAMKFSAFLPFLSMKSSKLFDDSLQVLRGVYCS